MKASPLLVALALSVGILVGHFVLPVLPARDSTPVDVMRTTPGAITRETVACDLSSQQIQHLSAEIAPAVVERLAASGLNGVTADPKVAVQQRLAIEQSKAQQVEAFTHATQLVDQMIASHQVTPQGLNEARSLLKQTGQSDELFRLDARVAAAINRRELTPADAGLTLPGESE